MAVIYYATDWYSVENELFSSYKNFRYEIFHSLDKMTKNIKVATAAPIVGLAT